MQLADTCFRERRCTLNWRDNYRCITAEFRTCQNERASPIGSLPDIIKAIYQLIQKLNEILHNADETMKNVVTATLEPIKIPLKFYCFAGVIATIGWSSVPFMLVFKKNLFYYEDYRIPVTFSKQPFSLRVFVLGSLFISISTIYLFLKKSSVEVYTMHLILMITAQYRYIALKMEMIFQKKNGSDESHSSALDRRKEKEMRALCRHHRDVL